ncbi:hypothetical protein [Urbifossiella limnaea]|uniref:Uncharacterized protein n=1 Tax=Urbifossiella limnaea TaxID=2528023 RepID=A0A517XST3_9BACT|nr:hypothetical protein [Urbifossiella limnaea]QDU20580.1 hypothetical protein ETAA1_25350 [Urbifossiella limnaea]
MSDPFMSALLGAREVKASARVKHGNETRTIVMRDTVPTDLSDGAFMDAARSGGVNLSVRVNTSDDRARTITGKDVRGAAAASATGAVLGYVAGEVPDAVKRRGRATPSVNGTPAEAQS